VVTVDLRIVGAHAIRNGVTPPAFAYNGDGARLPSLKGIMAAKKKPMAVGKLADYGAEPKPMIKEVGVTLPPPRAAGQIVADIPTLVKKLAEEAKVI
jgi:electron transfer flavoprotein alpha/beta subunit